jgi:Family of unknown function (DUF5330)
MWFLARAVFWLGLIIALLPLAPLLQETSVSKVGAVDSLSAASAAVSDIRQFCVRQPDACAAGSEAIAQFVQKAETGAKLLYQFLNERKVKDELPITLKSQDRPPTGRLSSSTLMPTDLAVSWRGPVGVR